MIEPSSGRLATHGEWGVGRLAEPAELLVALEAALAAERRWAGLRVLVSAGGTREPIDEVRFVGNRSSGRQGVALAEAAAARGAEVVLVAANVELPSSEGSVASTSAALPSSRRPAPPSSSARTC